jgi:hypothetical protein
LLGSSEGGVAYLWTVNGGGDTLLSSSDTLSTTFTPAQAGTYTLQFTAYAVDGNSDTSEIEITIHENGDINDDGYIDNNDFTLMMFNWGDPTNQLADFDSTGEVDNDDFTILMYWWNN